MTLEARLLSRVVDVVNAGNWQRGGGKGSKPKPFRFPGDSNPSGRRFGTAMPVEELRALLAERQRPAEVNDDGN